MQTFTPLPAPTLPVPPPAAERRPRRWLWVLLGFGAAMTLLMVAGVVAFFFGTAAPLIDDNLDSGHGPFVTESDALVTLEYADGGYRMLLSDGNTGPQLARSFWTPTVRSVTVAVTASVRGTAPARYAVGVVCVASGASYTLFMSPAGDTAITRALDNKGSTMLTEGQTVAARLTAPTRLRLDCQGGGTGATILTGYVDGIKVATATDTNGFESFRGIGVTASATQPLDVLFDNPYAKRIG